MKQALIFYNMQITRQTGIPGAVKLLKRQEERINQFLSIGYSTCHWCHVMAHESFENPVTAALLNNSFIAIKVDREERPDIDSVYMAVCQAYTGSGGWPLNIFMTWDKNHFLQAHIFRHMHTMACLVLITCWIQ